MAGARTLLGLIALAGLLVAACDDGPEVDASPGVEASATTVAATETPTTTATPVEEASPTAVLGSGGGGTSEVGPTPGVLMRGDAGLVPLDARTGEPLPGYEPVEVPFRLHEASPGGSLLPLSYSVGGTLEDGGRLWLELIDGERLGLTSSGLDADGDGVARRWDLEVGRYFPGSIRALAWAPDGGRVYALIGVGGESELWAFDVIGDSAEMLTTVSAISALLSVSPNGETIYLRARGPGGFIAAVDAGSGDEVARIEPFAPLSSTLPSVGGERMYAFGAGGKQIAVINLERMKIERSLVLPEAAFEPSFIPFATDVSPDGRWLYLSSMDEVAECPELLNGPCIVNRPLGLQVIDLSTMEIVHHEADINWFTVSADGQWVIGTSRMWDYRGLAPELHKYQIEEVGFGVKVIEVGSWEVAAHLEPDVSFWLPVLSPDGRYVYLTSSGPGYPYQRSDPPCVEDCSVITVIDLETLEVIATRVLDEGVGLVGIPAGE